MAPSQNRGLQFFVTMVVFLLLFFGFYYFISTRDKKEEAPAAGFEAAYINDGSAYISGIKAETPKKIAVARRIAWAPSGEGLYYIDNYAKLKYYDMATGNTRDVFINVADFVVSPAADVIAVVENGTPGHLKVITTMGDEVADIGEGTAPSWFREGQRLAYIGGGTVFSAAGGDWNSYPLYRGNPIEVAVSPDGKSILMTEWKDTESRLLLLDVAAKKADVIKTAAFEETPTASVPLGFSSVRFFADKNDALFVYNDKKGGRVYRLDPATKETSGIVEEPGPIYWLAVAPSGDRAAYFSIIRESLPRFTEIKSGNETPLVFGPGDLTQENVEALYRRGDNKEIGGEKLNNFNMKKLLDGDVIRVVDLEKKTYWPLGSGQYPVLK